MSQEESEMPSGKSFKIDHTNLDLFIVDDRRSLPLGAAYFVIAVDKDSRYVVGSYITYESPSIEKANRRLRDIVDRNERKHRRRANR